MSQRSERILFIAMFIALILSIAAGIASRTARDQGVELVSATIVHVDDSREWQTPRTLLEYENGQRGVITGYYGEVGDTFLIQRPAR